MALKIKRVYEPASPEDGVRVLVDRLWPRGLSKEKAQVDWWAKELAPSYPFLLFRSLSSSEITPTGGPFRGPHPGASQGGVVSEALRRFFAHDPGRYPEFLRRYQEELKGNPALERLKALSRGRTVTLLFGAKEERYNNARACWRS